MIAPLVDTNAITAVRLGDGWHEGVTDFSLFSDGQSNVISIAGAIWREPDGCRYSCPLSSILAVREGSPECENNAAHKNKTSRRDEQLESAIEWLKCQLQDGQPHPTQALRVNARNEMLIKSETLDRAWKSIGARAQRVNGVWCWILDAQNETAEPGAS